MAPAPGPPLRTILALGLAGLLYGAYALVTPRRGSSGTSRGWTDASPADGGTLPPAPDPPRAPDAGAPPAPPARVPERGPQRILLFGDSMVPVLSPRLADYCLENGYTLFPVVWYGSTIIHWAKVDELDQLLVEIQPTLVIAVLGSSELLVREVVECEPFVRLIARKVGSRKLVWIGPPNWRDDTGVNAMIDGALGPGRFFRVDATPLEHGIDGIHPTDRGGAAWADAFARWVRDESLTPIVLAPPSHSAPKVPARVISRHH